MPTFSYPELAADIATNTADGLRNVANTAADFLCNIYKKDPLGVTGYPDPTGFGKMANGLLSSLCAPRNKLPPPPQKPFTGGQCPERYNVYCRGKYGNYPEFNPVKSNVLGPIVGAVVKDYGDGRQWGGVQGAPDPPSNPTGWYPQFLINKSTQLHYWEVVNVVPVDGTDTCGDPEPRYPIVPILPVIDFGDDITVNFGNDFNVTVPVFFTPTYFDVDVGFSPKFDIKVGPFNVTFDLGGVTVGPDTPPPDSPPKTNPNPPSDPRNPLPSPEPAGGGECDLTPVIDRLEDLDDKVDVVSVKVDDIKECACPVDYDFEEVALGEGPGGVVALPANTVYVRLELTEIPINAKKQKGAEGHPDQYFCGYFEWGDGVALSPREALNGEITIMYPPVFATSFAWNLYYGFNCAVSCTKAKPEKVNSEFSVRQMKVKP